MPIFGTISFFHEYRKIPKVGVGRSQTIEVLLYTQYGKNQLCLQKFLQNGLRLKISYIQASDEGRGEAPARGAELV